jgi:hypothetical protein
MELRNGMTDSQEVARDERVGAIASWWKGIA